MIELMMGINIRQSTKNVGVILMQLILLRLRRHTYLHIMIEII